MKTVHSSSVDRGNLNDIFGITTILWPVISGIRVIRTLILCIMVVRPFFPFLVAIVVSVLLRFTESDYPFGFFSLFLNCLMASQPFSCGIKLSNNQQLLKKSSTQIWSNWSLVLEILCLINISGVPVFHLIQHPYRN